MSNIGFSSLCKYHKYPLALLYIYYTYNYFNGTEIWCNMKQVLFQKKFEESLKKKDFLINKEKNVN